MFIYTSLFRNIGSTTAS